MNKCLLLPLLLAASTQVQVQTTETDTAEKLAQEEQTIQLTDGVYREYRMAVLLTHEEFQSPKFGGDYETVKQKLKVLEDYLNSIYVRDLGAKFTMVYDERLAADDLLSVYADDDRGTTNINARIPADCWDVGVTMNYKGYEGSARGGRAWLRGIMTESQKGNMFSAQQEDRTVAHELAHLMGANHTFSTGSEPGSGQSIVGYGFSGSTHFLSLASIREIIPCLQYTDKRTPEDQRHTAGNTAPHIDRNRMKREYVVPKNTFFTIPVYASDAEQDSLYYMMNQWDYQPYDVAKFPTYAPSHNPVLNFGRVYAPGGTPVPGSNEIPVGEYKMLISVSDALPVEEAIARRQAPLYDNFLTMIKVVDATPFKITSGFGTKTYHDDYHGCDRKYCTTGERIKLTWDVDDTFFSKDDKVRVLLSDDAGATYKYVLVPETANDGECEIVLPQNTIDLKPTSTVTTEDGQVLPIFKVGQGQIRLEVIGKGFYDITENKPGNGGTEVQASPVRFSGLPETNYIRLNPGEPLPAIPTLTASKNGIAVGVTYSESREGNLLRRLWVASDGTDESAYVQWVECGSDDTTTGIDRIENEDNRQAPLYDWMGRRVTAPVKGGIYIRQGKKIVF